MAMACFCVFHDVDELATDSTPFGYFEVAMGTFSTFIRKAKKSEFENSSNVLLLLLIPD